VAVLCLLGISSPAKATTYSWFQSAAALSWCAQENGTSSPVYLDPCSTNSSDLWFSPSADIDLIENAHSQLCLTAQPGGVVDLQKCVPNDAVEEWITYYATNWGWTMYNYYYGTYLWQSNKSLVLRSSVDLNSTHDSWQFNTPS
jgi:hypothetical protein